MLLLPGALRGLGLRPPPPIYSHGLERRSLRGPVLGRRASETPRHVRSGGSLSPISLLQRPTASTVPRAPPQRKVSQDVHGLGGRQLEELAGGPHGLAQLPRPHPLGQDPPLPRDAGDVFKGVTLHGVFFKIETCIMLFVFVDEYYPFL